jgi:hypothetical protein
MPSFLGFIKEWLPSIAVVAWGVWLLFQWSFGEWLRRKKEIPSLEGKLSASIIPCENGTQLVTVAALWNNHSPLAINLDVKKCHIDVYRVDAGMLKETGVLVLESDLGKPICHHLFLNDLGGLFLEPNTPSTLINHFVLKPGIYGIRMELYIKNQNRGWWKELVVDVRAPKSKTHRVPWFMIRLF